VFLDVEQKGTDDYNDDVNDDDMITSRPTTKLTTELFERKYFSEDNPKSSIRSHVCTTDRHSTSIC